MVLGLQLAVSACSAGSEGAAPKKVEGSDELPAKAPAEAATATPMEVGQIPLAPAGPPPGPLTAEEEALIAANPDDLTPEERRARSQALRKKAMQDPNSPGAKAIRAAQAAIESGQVRPEDLPAGSKEGLWLHSPQVKARNEAEAEAKAEAEAEAEAAASATPGGEPPQ